MSQLPLPNFEVPPFNPREFAGWPMPGQGRPFFGGPPVSSLPFPSGFPVHSTLPYCVPQFRPGFIRSSFNSIPANHVLPHAIRASGHYFGQPQQQTANSQGKVTEQAHYNQNSACQTEFSCEACQRQFTSRDTLNSHTDAHVKCSIDGCSFEATRKVLKLHWIQVHAEGKNRIKLDTPEEIEKWREERKRNYPTLANVQKKEDENLKRRESGQVLKTRNFRYRKGQRGGREFQRGGRNHFYRRNLPRSRPEVSNGNIPTERCRVEVKSITENKDQTTESEAKEKSGEDPLSLVLEEHENENKIEDNMSISGKANCDSLKEIGSTVESHVNSALNSLCVAYASDSEGEECDRNEEVNSNKHSNGAEEGRTATTTAVNGTNEVNTKARSIKEHKTGNRQWLQSRKAKPKGHSHVMRMRKPTLLEKLLAPEIRHERNIILQCLRHIMKNNFFEVEGSQSISLF